MAKEKMIVRTEITSRVRYRNSKGEEFGVDLNGKLEPYEVVAIIVKEVMEVVSISSIEYVYTRYSMPLNQFHDLARCEVVENVN